MSPDGIIREPVLYLTWLILPGPAPETAQAVLRLVRLPADDAGRVTELAAALALAVRRGPDIGQCSRGRPEPRGKDRSHGMASGETGR